MAIPIDTQSGEGKYSERADEGGFTRGPSAGSIAGVRIGLSFEASCQCCSYGGIGTNAGTK